MARRPVGYAAVDPEASRELFIRHALVEGEWQTRHHFFADNALLRAEVAELEERARRRDLLVGDDEIYAFYDTRIPAEVVSARHFDGWWKKQRHRTPDLLTMTRADLLRVADADADRPDHWRCEDLSLPLTYRFEPGAADDGVTVHVPVGVLARLGGGQFGWQVPALREELVTALIRSLPKDLRRNFVPAPDTARAVLADLEPGDEPLLEVLQRELHRRTGVLVPVTAFDLGKLPAHLRVTFAVEGPDGTELARGRTSRPCRTGWPADPPGRGRRGRRRAGARRDPELARGSRGVAPHRGARWTVGLSGSGGRRDRRERPGVRHRGRTRCGHPAGLRRLLRLATASPVKSPEKKLDTRRRLTLAGNPDGSLQALLDDCADAAVGALAPAALWTRAEFEAVRKRVGGALTATTGGPRPHREGPGRVAAGPDAAAGRRATRAGRGAGRRPRPTGRPGGAGIRRRHRRSASGRPGPLSHRHLPAPRTVTARPVGGPGAHAAGPGCKTPMTKWRRALSPRAAGPDMVDIARMIQEFRVSLWAQQLGTARPVSEQRIYRALMRWWGMPQTSLPRGTPKARVSAGRDRSEYLERIPVGRDPADPGSAPARSRRRDAQRPVLDGDLRGVIADSGTGTPPAAAADTRVIDAAGATVMPGLVDAHVHLLLTTFDLVDAASWTAGYATVRALAEAGRMLRRGFTTVRDVGGADWGWPVP